MTRKLLITSILLLTMGTLGRIYAANYTYIDPNDILRDSVWLPISSFMFLAGALLLLVAAGLFGVNILRGFDASSEKRQCLKIPHFSLLERVQYWERYLGRRQMKIKLL